MWDYRGVTFYNVDGTHCIYVEQYCVYYGFKGIQQMRAFLSVSKHITTTLLSNPPLIYTRIRLLFSIVSIFQQISEPNEKKKWRKKCAYLFISFLSCIFPNLRVIFHSTVCLLLPFFSLRRFYRTPSYYYQMETNRQLFITPICCELFSQYTKGAYTTHWNTYCACISTDIHAFPPLQAYKFNRHNAKRLSCS